MLWGLAGFHTISAVSKILYGRAPLLYKSPMSLRNTYEETEYKSEMAFVFKNIVIPIFTSTVSILILQFTGIITRSEIGLSQIGVTTIVLWSAITVAVAAVDLDPQDAKFMICLAGLTGFVSLVQWTYSFEILAENPRSMVAAQLSIVALIIAYGYILRLWVQRTDQDQSYGRGGQL
jgi:hypothetical protein